MIGVGGLVVIIFMAGETGIRRIAVITVVARRTVVGNSLVRTIQRPIIIMNREGRRHPFRLGCMATGTIGRYVQIRVIRVGALIVICLMAFNASIRRIGIITSDMALRTVILNRLMRSGQRINIMIKC